MQCQEKNRALS